LDEVTEAQFKCDVPSHTQNDDLLVKVPSLEQILCRGRFRHPGSYRRIPSLSTVCTRTAGPTTPPLNAFGVFKNYRQAVRKIILTQRVENIQNTACGDGLPRVPSIWWNYRDAACFHDVTFPGNS
jgi:hypothetical protein